MKHRTDEAVEFLQGFRSEGPWCLTSIVPDGKTTTYTFGPKQVEQMRAWVEERQGRENLYFMVNPAMRPLTSKAKKADVAELAWLHVDIDPRAGEDPVAEKARALALLAKFDPPPTATIFSGNGAQAFWHLATPLVVNGDEAVAEDVEGYNLQLEVTLGADSCANLDRIMRLPGTINIPNAKKRKKGRVDSLAHVVEIDWSRVYMLDKFIKAPKVQQSKSAPGFSQSPHKVHLKGGNVERLSSVDDLGDKVSPYTKMLIVQGDDPDDNTKYPSRSEVVMRVCCDLVRAGVPDEVIFAVVTDPSFAISGSILEKPRSEKYALRQIERAKEDVIHPMLREMNEKHAVIADIGGKCRIISEVQDEMLKRSRLSKQSFDDFRNRYCHVRVQVGTDSNGKSVEKPVGAWWVNHPMRRQYDTIVFAPGRDIERAYNLWRGFACDAIPGDCSLYLEHVEKNVCRGNKEHADYIIKWMARAVQMPNCPGETALVFRGKRGTGKGTLVNEFGKLWGRHFMQVTDPKHLVGNFNAHLRDTVVLFGDEAFYAGDKKHEAVLKGLITEELLSVEAKGVDVETAANYTHIMLAANGDWVVPAGTNERRYFVLDVGEERMQDHVFFARLKKQMESGGRSALLHHLMTLDLTDFEVRRVPQTEALYEQKLLSMSPEDQWWYEKLYYGRLLERHATWEAEVPTRMLQNDYVELLHRMGIQRKSSSTALGRFLGKVCPEGWPKSSQRLAEVSEYGPGGAEVRVRQRAYFYAFPPLDQCRKAWDVRFGGIPASWPQPVVSAPEVRGTATDASPM